MNTLSSKFFYLGLTIIAIVCLTASTLTVMDPDAGQYAEMAREMMFSKHPLQLFCLGKPYLDKPPLLFWLTALSYKLFGVGNIAYRLPSLLFAALAVFSTYRFARLFYSENSARLASIMFASTHAFFMLTNDVRTDTLLVGSVMLSIWQMASFLQNQKWINLVFGAIGMSLAMLAKGPIGVLIPVYALLPHLLLTRGWKKIFDWRYGIVLLIITLFLLPMCLGLYQQFGLEGLRFYFWTQSFGRITGENIWNNNPDPFFLVHTTLWAFLPWTIFLFAGLLFRIRSLIMPTAKEVFIEHITTFGFLLTLISLMLSKYQLPHYVFVVYPLGAVIAADSFLKLSHKKWSNISQIILLALLWIFICVVNVFVFPAKGMLMVLLLICLLFTVVIYYRKKDIVLISLVSILSANLLMNLNFYPQLHSYQPSEEIGNYLRSRHITKEKLSVHFSCFSFALAFYYQDIYASCLAPIDLERAFKGNDELYVLIDESHFHELVNHEGWETEILKTWYRYGITQLNPMFLNPHTRPETLQKVYFVRLTLSDIH